MAKKPNASSPPSAPASAPAPVAQAAAASTLSQNGDAPPPDAQSSVTGAPGQPAPSADNGNGSTSVSSTLEPGAEAQRPPATPQVGDQMGAGDLSAFRVLSNLYHDGKPYEPGDVVHLTWLTAEALQGVVRPLSLSEQE